jgi:hypothetical protein
VAHSNVAVQDAIVDIYIGILVVFEGCEVALKSLSPCTETAPLAWLLCGASNNKYLKLVSDLLLDQFAPLLELSLKQVKDHLNRGFLTRQTVQLGPVVLEWLLVV